MFTELPTQMASQITHGTADGGLDPHDTDPSELLPSGAQRLCEMEPQRFGRPPPACGPFARQIRVRL
jgi:hypothetical protein